MGSPGDKHRVSVIHCRPSVIRPPRTDPPSPGYYKTLNTDPQSPGFYKTLNTDPQSPGFYKTLNTDPPSPGFYKPLNTDPPSPGYYKPPITDPSSPGYSSYSPHKDNMQKSSYEDYYSKKPAPLPPPPGYSPHPLYYPNSNSSNCSDNSSTNSYMEWSESVSLQSFEQNPCQASPTPTPGGQEVTKLPHRHPQLGPPKERRNSSKRARKLSGGSGVDLYTFPSDENSFPDAVAKKKIKLEGAAELQEKVGNKPISNCKVCGDLAVAHMHYGGVCCYSCKAFFRRATQTGKDKKYKCKAEQACLVTYTNRRACQFCRFSKCLEIGMRPNWVLSDEQCNIRFRNVRNLSSGGKEKSLAKEGSEDAIVIKQEVVDKGLLMPFTGEESKSLEYLVDCYTLSKETFTFSEENNQLWTKLFHQEGSRNPSEEKAKHNYSTFDLGSLIMTVIKKNIFFVKMNDKFNELTQNDQKLILQKNMSEMCHIRGAIRFDTKSKNFVWYFSKRDQMQMTFEKKSGSGPSTSSSSAKTKDVRLSNALIGQSDMSKFYKSTTSQSIFSLVGKLCEIGLPMEVFLVMINIVLFSSDNLQLEQPEVANNAQTYFMFFLHRYLNELFGRDDGRMKLSRIMGALVDLRELCERSKEEELARIKMKMSDN